jgi:hypothetical protein
MPWKDVLLDLTWALVAAFHALLAIIVLHAPRKRLMRATTQKTAIAVSMCAQRAFLVQEEQRLLLSRSVNMQNKEVALLRAVLLGSLAQIQPDLLWNLIAKP